MTKEEAKLVLDNARPQTKEIDRQFYDDEDLNNALDMAIKALEQETVSKATYDRVRFARKEAEQKFWDLKRNCIEIPKDASNGDMVKAMFPFSVASLDLIEHSVCLKTNDGNKSYYDFVWWNAPYKRGSENEVD